MTDAEWVRRLELTTALVDVLEALPPPDRREVLGQAERMGNLGSLLDSSDTAIGIAMADGRRLVACNEAACALLGRTKDALLTADLELLYVDPGQHKVLVSRAREYGCTHGMRVSMTRSDGHEVVLEMTVIALPEGGESVLLFIAKLARRRDWVYETEAPSTRVIG